MPCLNSPFVLMSAFEEFVSRALYMHFCGGEGEKKEISLPEAHHAVSPVMQRITSALNQEHLLFWCYQSSEGVNKGFIISAASNDLFLTGIHFLL